MNKYSGSDFDDFLREEGILEEVTARAHKRLLALQLSDAIEESYLTKKQLAEKLQTSRSQLDRLLDPDNTSVTLDSLQRLAQAVGKELKVELSSARAEYDFSGRVRGKYAREMQEGYTVTVHRADGSTLVKEVMPTEGVVILEPDVQEYFPDSDSVNEALRGLIRLIPAKQTAPAPQDSNQAVGE